jgi:hypothetical protein
MLTRSRAATAVLVLALSGMTSCRAAGPTTAPAAETRAIELTLDALYDAFCFDAHEEPDWTALRRLVAEGAAFVAPIAEGTPPVAVDTDEFLADFREFIQSSALRETGFHERITHSRIDVFGTVAHAYVVFEGFVPGGPTSLRGLDSIQLVRDDQQWLVASFTTQYETTEAPLPARFLR